LLPELVRSASPVAGGSINQAFRCILDDGTTAFVKTREDAPAQEWQREADGLAWLAEPGAIGIPRVLGVGETWLMLEWIEEGAAPDPEALGRGLATLHRAGADALGAPWTYGFGAVELGNEAAADWAEFYAQRRLLPLARRAADRGALAKSAVRDVESVCARLGELIPPDPAARLHGDLWTGNVMGDRSGRPWLVDPAAHGGHREVDLAMLTLFGSPGPACFAAYDEVWPRADGHEDRVELFQLLPLLAHAVLFGGSYGASAARVARRYA
jgi:fructosamine-3-kinase